MESPTFEEFMAQMPEIRIKNSLQRANNLLREVIQGCRPLDVQTSLVRSEIDDETMATFLYANGQLSATQVGELAHLLHYHEIFLKVRAGQEDTIPPSRLAKYLALMTELAALNSMRAEKALDQLAEAHKNQK